MGQPHPSSRPAHEGSAEVLAVGTADHLHDAELVERARAGDGWAKEALFRRHVRAVTGTVIRLLGRHHEAEDVVQETFATAFSELSGLRDGSAIRAWLMQIAVRKLHRIFRRRKLLRMLGLEQGYDDAALGLLVDPAAGTEAAAELALIDEFLATLPGPQRIAWMLRAVEGESIEDVARICDCSIATVKRRVKDVEVRLERHLGKGARR
jgi:RNA polymerase sigma-70 factor (ECF subfamily)